MKMHLWSEFIAVIKKEVVPALGCTEPISVALAAAIAAQKLSGKVQKIAVCVSPNLMKNGMGVGVPGTGMVGLPIAAAVGAIAGDPTAGLEVLKRITPKDVIQAKALLNCDSVSVNVADVSYTLYAKVTVSSGIDFITVTIADSHTQVLSIEENGVSTYIAPQFCSKKPQSYDPFKDIVVKDLYDFAVNIPISYISFIEQAQTLNEALSIEGLTENYGLQVGMTFQRNIERGLLSHGLLTDVIMHTSAAADARMDGAMKTAMSNSGSGNQGITATVPVVVAAAYLGVGKDKTLRALVFSHLVAIYIKSQQHKLSALCGASTAAMGAAAAITFLLGGNYQQISHSLSSMIADIAGIICDGAKPSCALKVSSAAGAAVKAALLALDGMHASGDDGIVTNDVDQSIQNLCALVNGSMMQTDVQILDIMINK
ncbi:serine dehydratase subunit alpha family protein [Psychromonas antarctica]|jgi:L-cysteine desulfidase|uniref:L-cysteine desulfidase family protein n=1 Tax=Psychromonas antarctica TaxID=67573 RepID=UPI001EE97883|nr:L-serine ammonia-lyase, iron-sulfur-dependent, subunit alpha [Psychromonas antarctica]MCG6200274.1 L-serine ammonia-lyase, iron-sulfur-dependent, subunit alpha [Psychromonas antarctica]